MKRLWFVICFCGTMLPVFALNMVNNTSFEGLNIQFPSNYKVSHKQRDITNEFYLERLCPDAKNMGYLQIYYGFSSEIQKAGGQEAFCENRMNKDIMSVIADESFKNTKIWDSHVENYGKYSVGIIEVTSDMLTIPIDLYVVVAANDNYFTLILMMSTQKTYIEEMTEILGTARFSELGDIKGAETMAKYYKFKEDPSLGWPGSTKPVKIDLTRSFNYAGLTIRFPQNWSVIDKHTNTMNSVQVQRANPDESDDNLAKLQFTYGKCDFDGSTDDLKALCNNRLEAMKWNIRNIDAYKNVKWENNYAEDRGNYAIGVSGCTASIFGHTVWSGFMVMVTRHYILMAMSTGAKEEFMTECQAIMESVIISDVPHMKVGDLYAHSKDTQDRPQTDVAATSAAPSSRSEVDRNIPVSKDKNDKIFAVIIANENYQEEASVPYAMNDGEIFRRYCLSTLGLPNTNIHYRPNATLNNIRAELRWLKQVCDAYEGQANVIFYYAGHGIPDEATKSSYLLPVDGVGSDVSTGYQLDDLYSTLGSLSASRVIVFMDACFSGSKREEGMMASARGVALKAKAGAPQGNMVVFSAATGDETAYPNKDEKHGMFTYFLLKKLQDSKGDITLYELSDYITTSVRQQSIVKNGKSQTPTVNASNQVGTNWQNWKLK